MSQSLYEFLGIRQDASDDDIRQAIRQKADDIRAGGDVSQMQNLTAASEVLLSAEKRRAYDAKLRRPPHVDRPAAHVTSPIDDQHDKAGVDHGVLLLCLPLAFAVSIMLLLSFTVWPMLALGIVLGLFGVMTAVTGILAGIEVGSRDKDSDPVPGFIVFISFLLVWPLAYVMYMGRRQPRGVTVVAILVAALSVTGFAVPAFKINAAQQRAEQALQKARAEQDRLEAESRQRYEDAMRRIGQPPYQQQ